MTAYEGTAVGPVMIEISLSLADIPAITRYVAINPAMSENLECLWIVLIPQQVVASYTLFRSSKRTYQASQHRIRLIRPKMKQEVMEEYRKGVENEWGME